MHFMCLKMLMRNVTTMNLNSLWQCGIEMCRNCIECISVLAVRRTILRKMENEKIESIIWVEFEELRHLAQFFHFVFTLGCTRYVSTHSTFSGTVSTINLYPKDLTTSNVCSGKFMYGTNSGRFKRKLQIRGAGVIGNGRRQSLTRFGAFEISHNTAENCLMRYN